MTLTTTTAPFSRAPAPGRTPAASADPLNADPSIAAQADDSWGDIVEELSAIRPSHRSRKSQIADFLLRRKSPALGTDALSTATRAHTSRFFREALRRHGCDAHPGDRHEGSHAGARPADEPMAELLLAIKPAKGTAALAFEMAKIFAAKHTDEVAQLLADGADEFTQELQIALVRAGMGGARARSCTEVIYAALVAQFAADIEAARCGHYLGKIAALDSAAHTLPSRLKALNGIEAELASETCLSSAGIAHIKSRLAELRPLLEQSALQHEMMIGAATKDITTDTPVQHIQGRLRELDERSLAIDSSLHLSSEARQQLHSLLQAARTMLTALQARPAYLEALAGQPRIQGALQGLGAREYVKAQLALTHTIDHTATAFQAALLERLNEIILGPREAGWLVAMQQGDADITDMVLPGAQWDEQAWSLKLSAPGVAGDDLALLNLSAQHERRKAARELDNAMQSAALKSSTLKTFPVNAFQALKADAALIGWFARHAPQMVGERDLAIANWIRLSLHDKATGKPDAALCDELFRQLRTQGIATGAMETHARQGFNSTGDVQACVRQIQAFSLALQKNSLVAAVDPQVRAAQIGMQLLEGLGIKAEHINDPGIDAQAGRLITKALQGKSGAKELLRSLRRVAVIQVATQSSDPHFSPSGQNAAGTYSSQVINRLTDMGLDLDSPHPLLKETATHLRQKLPADARSIEKLCGDFDPASVSNRAGALLKTAFTSRPGGRVAADGNAAGPAAKPAPAIARRAANEATLKAAVESLQPNEVVTITFGVSGQMSVSAPVVPGLALATSLSAGKHNSIQLSRAESGAYHVEILGGASARQGVSITTVMDVLEVSLGVSQAREKGHRLSFGQQADCEAFLAAVANGGDIAPHLQAARSVETAAHTARAGDVAVTATADFTIASLSVAVAATAGERHSVHQNNLFKREVFSRDVSAEVVLKAALVGDLASAQAGAGIDLGVRRSVIRENGMLAGGPQGSAKADMSPTLSMVARVTHGNKQRCLDTLLPGASAAQKQAIAAQLGEVEDGTEMFTRYRLNETARVQANMLLGKAGSALTQAAMQRPGPTQQALREQAVSFVKQADAVTRNAANYAPEGFGWALRSGTAIERSRGAYTLYAGRAGEQAAFVPFDATPGGTAPVDQSLLLAAMA